VLVKIQDVWLNPAHVVSVDETEIIGVTRIVVSEGGERTREYVTELSPLTVVRKLNQRRRRP
jgi:hypothetical protein